MKDSAVVLPTVLPGQPTPDWIVQAPTVRELAERIGVDTGGLDRDRRPLERGRGGRER